MSVFVKQIAAENGEVKQPQEKPAKKGAVKHVDAATTAPEPDEPVVRQAAKKDAVVAEKTSVASVLAAWDDED